MADPTFSLRIFPRRQLKRYIAEVDALRLLEEQEHVDPDEFASESILLHGGDPDPIDDVEAQDLVKVHKGMAKSYLNSHMTGVPPIIIANMEVCGDRMKPKWRTGDHAKFGRTVPAGRYSMKLAQLWELFAEIGLRELTKRDATPRTKRVFCAAMHDALIVLRPMLQGNARTAHLLEQPLRIQLGLRPRMYRKQDEMFHDKRISAMHDLIAPVLRTYNFV